MKEKDYITLQAQLDAAKARGRARLEQGRKIPSLTGENRQSFADNSCALPLAEKVAEKARIPVKAGAGMPSQKFTVQPTTDEAKMNGTERRWLSELRALEVQELGIQSVTLKLGDDCRYTPDFTGIDDNGHFTAWEVKGFMRDDALVKIKTAARQYRWIKFVLVRRVKGRWEIKEIKP